MTQPLLSVVVPCYNVERYMDKCISSIVGQTYTNLEILLINDGSTDNTGIRCDAWQERDQRIRVVHQQNQGVSITRKIGVDIALGEYVTFVDSDDWIDSSMYTDLISALLSTDSDIAHCDYCIVHPNGCLGHRVDIEQRKGIQIMGRTEGVMLVMEDRKWRTSFFTKIFKKRLFDNVEFPKGRIYAEDMIIHEIFHQASQTVFLDCEYYFYNLRSGSVSRRGNVQTEIKKLYDACEAHFERCLFIERNPAYHSLLPSSKKLTISLLIYTLQNIVTFPQYFPQGSLKIKMKQLISIPIDKNDKISTYYRIYITVARLNPKCFIFLRRFIILLKKALCKIMKLNTKNYNLLSDIWHEN